MDNSINNKNQILFDFKFNQDYLDQDYYLSSSNQDAHNLISCWLNFILDYMFLIIMKSITSLILTLVFATNILAFTHNNDTNIHQKIEGNIVISDTVKKRIN